MIASDRIFGLVVATGALAFLAGAFGIQTSFLSDPLGPKVFPMLIGSAGFITGIAMVARPDPDPSWPTPALWLMIGLATLVLLGYAWLIRPMGFLLSTALASALTSFMIYPNWKTALPTGVGLSALLFIAFKYGLGLGLHAWPQSYGG